MHYIPNSIEFGHLTWTCDSKSIKHRPIFYFLFFPEHQRKNNMATYVSYTDGTNILKHSPSFKKNKLDKKIPLHLDQECSYSLFQYKTETAFYTEIFVTVKNYQNIFWRGSTKLWICFKISNALILSLNVKIKVYV